MIFFKLKNGREKENPIQKTDFESLTVSQAACDRLKEENATLREELSEARQDLERLKENLARQEVVIPVIKVLNSEAEGKTEKAVVKVTDDIFDISDKSVKLGAQISKILGDTFIGTGGLDESMKKLMEVVVTINRLIKDFNEISSRFGNITLSFDAKMKEIKAYLANIVELSEETNLLAINTAIEAARMGSNAGGFTVISKEIQKLSDRSSKIAGTIGEMIGDVDVTLEKSFNSFNTSALSFGGTFGEIVKSLENISNGINTKINIVQQSIEETREIPSEIKNDLHSVIEELQFQDITRQIQQHIIQAVQDVYTMNRASCVEEGSPDVQIDIEKVRKEVFERISRNFTVAEEWEAVGMDIPLDDEDTNVTLF